LRVERQIVLKPLKPIKDKKAYKTEHQHGRSISCPVLLLVLINVAYTINQPLYWTKDPAQKNPFSGKYLSHVDPKWLGYGK
jgi:hypothetical protein